MPVGRMTVKGPQQFIIEEAESPESVEVSIK